MPETESTTEPVTVADEHNPQDGAVYHDPESDTYYISDGPEFGARDCDSVVCWTVSDNTRYSHFADIFRGFHKVADTLADAAEKGLVEFDD